MGATPQNSTTPAASANVPGIASGAPAGVSGAAAAGENKVPFSLKKGAQEELGKEGYNQFVRVCKDFKDGTKSLTDAVAAVQALLAGKPDLIEQFKTWGKGFQRPEGGVGDWGAFTAAPGGVQAGAAGVLRATAFASKSSKGGVVATDSTASGNAAESMTGAVVAGSPQDVAIKADLMKRELRIIKAVVEHSACYEGFGDHVVGEFATMGEKEIAAMLDETTFDDHKILASLMELALSAGQFEDFHWAVRALECCVVALENKKESANLSTCSSASELRTLATPSKQKEVANAAFALVVQVQVPERVCVSLCECVPPQTLTNASFRARLHSSTLNRMFSICAGEDTS
jgi:hypothetical protein